MNRVFQLSGETREEYLRLKFSVCLLMLLQIRIFAPVFFPLHVMCTVVNVCVHYSTYGQIAAQQV